MLNPKKSLLDILLRMIEPKKPLASLERMDAENIGELIYFFELACAISATLSGVNPFDQPGVEAYKKELKKLLA